MKNGKKVVCLIMMVLLALGILTGCGDSNSCTVTYHYNADGMADQKVTHTKDSRLTTENTEREGYSLLGWYTDEALTQAFSSGTKVSENLDLYAKWGKSYTLEAEYVDLSSFHGQGFSGGCDGAQAISQDKANLGASNGVYLTYMYNQGLSVTFEFTSDAAVTDATVILRLSAEMMDIQFSSSDFTVALNGKTLNYSDISLTNGQNFEDFVVGTNCALNEGTNTITLTTTNSKAMAGTMYATAPTIDCVKIVSSSNIAMVEHQENMDKFSMD
jgi:uncharacterized repeat protein (TIGR02543 family)